MDQELVEAAERRHTTIGSELGELIVVARGRTVVGLYFPDHWYRPDSASFGLRSPTGFEAVRDQISEFLAGGRQEFAASVPGHCRPDRC